MMAVLPSSARRMALRVDWFPRVRYASVELSNEAAAPDPPGLTLQEASVEPTVVFQQSVERRRPGLKSVSTYWTVLWYWTVDVPICRRASTTVMHTARMSISASTNAELLSTGTAANL